MLLKNMHAAVTPALLLKCHLKICTHQLRLQRHSNATYRPVRSSYDCNVTQMPLKDLYAAVMPALPLKRRLKICMQQLSHSRFPTACQQTTDLHDSAKRLAVRGKRMKRLDTPLFTLGSQEQ